MLSDSHISELHDFPDTSDCFPGKNIRGGICYFKWERNHNGDCRIVNHFGDNEDSMYRPIKEDGCDVFIRSNKAISILQKVMQSGYARMGNIVSSRNPFQIVNTVQFSPTETAEKNIKLYQQKGKIGYISLDQVGRNTDWINKYLVITAKASPGGDDYPHSIIGAPKISEPGSVCTETFLVIGVFDTEKEAENLISYMRTRFFRFMMFLVRNGQNLTKSTYTFVPNLDYTKSWTDEELYELFDIKPEEIEYINTMIRPME
jgi:site-specific DNA-methyltransferase (adenine-specific)